MNVFEIVKPGYQRTNPTGSQPSGQLPEDALLHQMETCFFDANLALILYDEATKRVQEWGTNPEVRRPYKEAHRDLDARRQLWRSGLMPETFIFRAKFLHAHSFVYALEGFWRALNQMQNLPAAPPILPALRDSIASAVPHLKGVRDSAHHIDERVQGRTQSGTKQEKKQFGPSMPLPNPLAAEGRSELIVSSFIGNSLSYTKADGHLGQVEITPTLLGVFQSVLQQLLEAFQWDGNKHVLPR